MLSSSSIPVTVAPLARAKLVDTVKVPVTAVFFSNSIVPVPLGIILIASFDLAEVIFQPLISRLPPSCGDVSSITKLVASSSPPYNSVKFAFIFVNAVLNGSPVPSFALDPISVSYTHLTLPTKA